MNHFGILIQKTTAGANIEYISSNLNIAHPDIVATNYDERKEVTQIANGTNVYSIQSTNSYRVYSLIITNITDNMGRLGYIAIRIYAPVNSNITNFTSILEQLYELYTIKSASKTIGSFNEDSILLNINSRAINTPIIALPDDQVYFLHYDPLNSDLVNNFNATVSRIVKKIYAFDKRVSESIIRNFRFESLVNSQNSYRIVQINNPYRLLRDLKINNVHLIFDPNIDRLEVYCKQNDQLYYNTTDQKKDRLVFGNSLIVERQVVSPPPVGQGGGSASFNFLDKYGTALILSCMAILISGIVWFFIHNDNNKSTPPQVTTYVPTPPPDGGNDEFQISIVENKVDKKSGRTLYRFNTNPNWYFVYENNEWKFGDTTLPIKKYAVFNQNNFNENNFGKYVSILDSIHKVINSMPNTKNNDIKEKNDGVRRNGDNKDVKKNGTRSTNNGNSNHNSIRNRSQVQLPKKFELKEKDAQKDYNDKGGTNLP